MKKLAESKGAELAPISVTGGMSAGRGVVSTRVAWLNLEPIDQIKSPIWSAVYKFH